MRPLAGAPAGRAAAMSAEAADREAATSSRPCTPPQTSWFEFLLEEALLEQHLQKPSPGACGAAPLTAAAPRFQAPPGVAPWLLTGSGEETLVRFPASPFPRSCGLQLGRCLPGPAAGAASRRPPSPLLRARLRLPRGRRRGVCCPALVTR